VAKKPKRSMPKRWTDPEAARIARRAARPSRRKPWLWAGVIGILIMAAGIGTGVLAGPKGSQMSQDNYIDKEVSLLLGGIPQQGRTLGVPTAPFTLQVFADLEDKDSKRWTLTFLPTIIKQLVRTDVLRIEYRAFRTNTVSSETFVKQQAAAIAAGAQDKFWNYIDTFYHEQGIEYTGYVTERYLDNIAIQIPGLKIPQWHYDRNHGMGTKQVFTDDKTGRVDGLHVTPSYRLGRTNDPLKNFTGSETHLPPNQIHPTSFASAKDIANAIKQID
jgi:hypothetical protein